MKTTTLLLVLTFLFASVTLRAQILDTNHVDAVLYLKVTDSANLIPVPYDFSIPALNTLYTTYSIDTMVQPFLGLSADLDLTYKLFFSDSAQIDALLGQLNGLPMVDYAEKVPIHKVNAIPDDLGASQWALVTIRAAQAWDRTTGSATITVAIVDNAVSTTHEDLVGNLWINPGETPNNFFDDDLNGYRDDYHGYDVADGDPDPNPPAGTATNSPFVHGTHCAGIAAASTNNGIGIASVGYNITFMAIKCSGDSNSEEGRFLTHSYEGVAYAMRAGADIVSMSWGSGSSLSITGQNVMTAAHADGIVLVAAAGNDNSSSPFYPAAFADVISVGSTGQTDQKSGFSNYGATIDVMAPGSGIYSTLAGADDAYGNLSGTSMACPLVAGLCGLILSESPNMSPDEVETALEAGCDNIDLQNPTYVGQMGAGRINAQQSLDIVSGLGATATASRVELRCFPNPTADNLYIQAGDEAITKVRLVSAVGQVFLTQSIQQQSTTTLDVSGLAPGWYALEVHTASELLVRPVLIF